MRRPHARQSTRAFCGLYECEHLYASPLVVRRARVLQNIYLHGACYQQITMLLEKERRRVGLAEVFVVVVIIIRPYIHEYRIMIVYVLHSRRPHHFYTIARKLI